MISRAAQYLLRFDDLCPTIPRECWERFRKLTERFGVHPILAIVPDNRDPELASGPADPAFWDAMRALEAAGACVAVHGHQHLCQSKGKSLLGLHTETEFAGVDFATQRQWIQAGFRILRDQNLHPRLWIAPRHGFDLNTLQALRDTGVEYISDGFARIPHRRHGITWIPQQLWSPVLKQRGLWTICIHPHTASSSDAARLEQFLELHADAFTSFDRAVKEYSCAPLGWLELTHERIELLRMQRRHRKQRSR